MNFKTIKKDFPILSRRINGKPLVYLDSAATSQKPKQVLDAIQHYYTKHNANVHRGIHTLSVEATEQYELARKKVAEFVKVKDPAEIIFVKNATEAINLVAYSWAKNNVGKDDEIVLTIAEHHSNFVVWQQLAAENGAVLKVVPVLQSRSYSRSGPGTDKAHSGSVNLGDDGLIDLEAFKQALTKKTKFVTLFHVSNVLGTVNDVRRLSLVVRHLAPQAKVLVDGAQAVPHMPVNISKIGCDFYVFTGHKMLGPMGIGVLWAKKELLLEMPPFLYGGDMISKVSLEKSSWNELPWKFEAGTPDAAAALGLMSAVAYLSKIGMDNVRKHEVELTEYALLRLGEISKIKIYGSLDAKKRGGVISFNVGNIHAHDVASILDGEGVAIRSGHHCAQPLMDYLGISSVARASFYIYNDKSDVDKLIEGIEKVKKTFKIK